MWQVKNEKHFPYIFTIFTAPTRLFLDLRLFFYLPKHFEDRLIEKTHKTFILLKFGKFLKYSKNNSEFSDKKKKSKISNFE
jgi:hypothetical protein